jgi:hypothetical protein
METQSLGKKIVPVSEVAEKWKFVGKNLKKKRKARRCRKKGHVWTNPFHFPLIAPWRVWIEE